MANVSQKSQQELDRYDVIAGIDRWKESEYGRDEDEVKIINIAETNAEYDDDLLFGVDCNINNMSLMWYIQKKDNNTDEFKLIWANTKIFNSYNDLMDFIDSRDFDEMVSEDFYEESGISKYE